MDIQTETTGIGTAFIELAVVWNGDVPAYWIMLGYPSDECCRITTEASLTEKRAYYLASESITFLP